MNLQNRIKLIELLGNYLNENNKEWESVKAEAAAHNPWFTSTFIDKATQAIRDNFLSINKLENWISHYHLDDLISPKNIGIVMAGNIPMVGFHDFLAVFISGHHQTIKFSTKDNLLLKHLIHKLYEFDPQSKNSITIAETLKGCDAYIATGNNQSALYFHQYFGKYPNIIRKNRTSAAILNGNETEEELRLLSDDIHFYFGLGCRNVTKIYVPSPYDFVPLLKAFEAYHYFRDHHKYSNNYDYQLSILLLNNIYYMTNENTLLVENKGLFSPISVLHYEYYMDKNQLKNELSKTDEIQCVVGHDFVPFGKAQEPDLFSYADGIDTMQFLLTL